MVQVNNVTDGGGPVGSDLPISPHKAGLNNVRAAGTGGAPPPYSGNSPAVSAFSFTDKLGRQVTITVLANGARLEQVAGGHAYRIGGPAAPAPSSSGIDAFVAGTGPGPSGGASSGDGTGTSSTGDQGGNNDGSTGGNTGGQGNHEGGHGGQNGPVGGNADGSSGGDTAGGTSTGGTGTNTGGNTGGQGGGNGGNSGTGGQDGGSGNSGGGNAGGGTSDGNGNGGNTGDQGSNAGGQDGGGQSILKKIEQDIKSLGGHKDGNELSKIENEVNAPGGTGGGFGTAGEPVDMRIGYRVHPPEHGPVDAPPGHKPVDAGGSTAGSTHEPIDMKIGFRNPEPGRHHGPRNWFGHNPASSGNDLQQGGGMPQNVVQPDRGGIMSPGGGSGPIPAPTYPNEGHGSKGLGNGLMTHPGPGQGSKGLGNGLISSTGGFSLPPKGGFPGGPPSQLPVQPPDGHTEVAVAGPDGLPTPNRVTPIPLNPTPSSKMTESGQLLPGGPALLDKPTGGLPTSQISIMPDYTHGTNHPSTGGLPKL